MKKKNIYIIIGILVIVIAAGFFLLKPNGKTQTLSNNQSSTQSAGNQRTPVDSISHAHGLSIDVNDGSKVYIATHHGLLILQNDTSLSRIGTVEDDLMGFSVHPSNPKVYFSSGHPATGGNLGFQKSTDGGLTWEKISDGINGPVDYHAMTVSPANPNIIYGTYAGSLQKSENEGKRWEIVRSVTYPIINLATDPKDENVVYAASSQGLKVSNNKGSTWTNLLDGFVSTIAINPHDPKKLLVYSEKQQLAKSIDGGKTWETITTNFGGETPLYISFNKQQPEILYLLTEKNSIYKSTDEGISWSKIR